MYSLYINVSPPSPSPKKAKPIPRCKATKKYLNSHRNDASPTLFKERGGSCKSHKKVAEALSQHLASELFSNTNSIKISSLLIST